MKLEDVKHLIKWDTYTQYIGGQQVGAIPKGVRMYCEELGFYIGIDQYKSQLKNKETCLLLFELYLSSLKDETN